MSADLLRRTAADMRAKAEAATPGGPRWETGPDEMHGPSRMIVFPADSDSAVAFAGADDAPHIASWHPAVALAVADWLDAEATKVTEWRQSQPGKPDIHYSTGKVSKHALAVARAYLGEESSGSWT